MPRNQTRKPPPRRSKQADAQPVAPEEPSLADDAAHTVGPDGDYGRVEIRRRVAAMLTAGYSPGRIAEDLMEPPGDPDAYREDFTALGGFGVSRATANRYVRHVRERWAELEAEDRPYQRARLIRIQEGILRDTRQDRDWKGANGAVRNLIDLFGLKLTKVEVANGGLDALIDALRATPAQREDEIARLEAKAREAGIDLDAPEQDGGG